ncbi:MAG: hypothetical protein A3E82_09570 [Gammaproteobacteria bacterium RIFCSPHIGHO2_12_FULL_38_11]|nr:MAG: hypothetical protein A3E82_09570 [Gammaproteobacteria bacterium RIFCSPHIGHO2_12_FULL_38_11]
MAADHSLNQASQSLRGSPVKHVLLPPLILPVSNDAHSTAERHFDVSANAMPAHVFFMGLVEGTSYNMLVDPSATGNITLHLKNVTIEQTLDATRKLYGYQYKKTALGYEILPPTMMTQVFTIDYLNIKRTGQSQTQLVSTNITDVNSYNNSNNLGTPNQYSNNTTTPMNTPTTQPNGSPQGSSSTIVTKVDNDFWHNLHETLKTLIGNRDGRWIALNPQANIVMVHAYPAELREVSNYLAVIQKNLHREVIIEAKILEITLNDNYQAGINWKILGANQSGINGLTPSFANDGQMFSLTLDVGHGDFTSAINLLAQQGNIQVLSSPHIATINNQEAVIKVGNAQFYVTGYTSNITPTGSTNTTSQSVELNPFFSGITLDVTPQISQDGGVILFIHPSISHVVDQNKTIQLASTGTNASNNTLTLPLASSTVRESDNVVHAQDGQIVVIGGLMQNTTTEVVAGTPWLSKMPFFGTVARNTNQTSVKTELVILLRPVIVNNKIWSHRLKAEADRFNSVQRGYHFGGLPQDFGTEGERPS